MMVFAAASVSVFGAGTTALVRYPYLSDAAGTLVTVNWATDRLGTSGSARWGPAGSSCDLKQVAATKQDITVNGTREYQWKAVIGPLSPDTAYCYRVFRGGNDLLGSDPSPKFTAPVAPSSASYTFAVFGDSGAIFGQAGNPDQANLINQIAASGARFTLFTGDIPYGQSGQSLETAYGDLRYPFSAVFATNFWPVAGRSIPIFLAPGNHGLSTSFIGNWPQAGTAASSGGRYRMDTYSGADGTTAAKYPSAWYAFDFGNARFYVLDTAWTNANLGTASNKYQADYDYHWNTAKPGCIPAPCGLELNWLANDLANHRSQLKFAVFHFPLYSDNRTEGSDSYLRADGPAGTNSLEALLSRYGVDIVFNGHAHLYERNLEQHGIVSYVTGGGGATLEPISSCSPFDAYAVGWSPPTKKGSACNAPLPGSTAQVTHFLLVTVSGAKVTVAPTDSQGRTFDVQTYDFG
jgi:hypothetical protein